MRPIVPIVLVTVFILSISFIFANIIYQISTANKCRISFNQFKTLYYARPGSWRFCCALGIFPCDYIEYLTLEGDRYKWVEIYMSSYIDHLQLARFVKNEDRNKEKKATIKDMETLIECWQRDIDKAIKKTEGNK